MTIALIIFLIGVLCVLIFLIWKAPLVADLSEEKERTDSFFVTVKERIVLIAKDFKARCESLLQSFLAIIRRVLIKVEQITTKWLCSLKKRKKKENEKEDH